MGSREVKFWKGFFIAIILAGLVTITVWAISLMIDGSVIFTSADPLTLTVTGVNHAVTVYDQGPAMGLNCQATFTPTTWTVSPENSSNKDICEYSFAYNTDTPVYIGQITQDPLAAGIMEVRLNSPSCGSLIPAGSFDVVMVSEILSSIAEGVLFDFTDFSLAFDESPTVCP